MGKRLDGGLRPGQSRFTLRDVCNYHGISIITGRRWIGTGRLRPPDYHVNRIGFYNSMPAAKPDSEMAEAAS